MSFSLLIYLIAVLGLIISTISLLSGLVFLEKFKQKKTSTQRASENLKASKLTIKK